MPPAPLKPCDERVFRVEARRVVAHDRGHARQPVGRGPLAQVITVLPGGEGDAHEEWRQARRACRAARHHHVRDAGFGRQRRNRADVGRPLPTCQDLHALANDQLARQPLRDIGRRAGFVALDQLKLDALGKIALVKRPVQFGSPVDGLPDRRVRPRVREDDADLDSLRLRRGAAARSARRSA